MHGEVEAVTCREATRQFRNCRLDTNETIRGNQKDKGEIKKMSQNATGGTPFPLGVFVGNPNYYDLTEEATFESNFNASQT